MADPFTPAFIAANCIWAMIQNRADAAAMGSVTRLAGVLRKQKTPANHDVLAATHTAFVRSIQLMADACENAGGDAKAHFVARVLARVAKDRDFTTFSADARAIPKKELDANIRAIFEGAETDTGRNAAEAVIVRLEQAMGEPMIDAFRALFRDGSDKHRSWPQAFELFFAEQVKTNERVFRALMFDRLNEVLALAEARAGEIAALHDVTDAFRGEVHGRFDSVDGRLGDMAGDVKDILARLSRQEQHAPIALLRSLAEAFGEARPNADTAQLESYLRAKIGEYHQLRERIEAVQHEDNHDAALLANANLAIDKGAFDRADEILSEAEDFLDERIDRFLIRKSERRALRGDAAKLKGDYKQAIGHYDAAADMLPANAVEERADRSWSAASAAREWGEYLEPAALTEAVHRWRALADGVSRHRSEELWAGLQNNLGNVLQSLGERSEGTEVLNEAVAALRAALAVRTRERFPQEWAATQNNLGTALGALGERQEGTAALDEAVEAFRAALEVLDRDLQPVEWATAQNNLGATLRKLSTKTEGTTTALEEAVVAYRAALEIVSRERDPIDWAMTQNNLGIALSSLGARNLDNAALADAVNAFRTALEVYTQDRTPVMWATVQNNLGNAYFRLSMEEEGTMNLKHAIDCYRSALEVRTREKLALHWALTMENLARALASLALKSGNCAVARDAVVAAEGALEVFTHPDLSWNRAKAERGLALARDARDFLCGDG